jgi:surface protein
MFDGAAKFNAKLSNWNTAEVIDMAFMFSGASSFEGTGLGNWKTGNVMDMSAMFSGAARFNANLSNWDTGNVTSMYAMFGNAVAFKGTGLGNWDTSNVTNMSAMFENATAFEGEDLGNWDVTNVDKMQYMFRGAVNFSADLKGWKISTHITNHPNGGGDYLMQFFTRDMFENAPNFKIPGDLGDSLRVVRDEVNGNIVIQRIMQ